MWGPILLLPGLIAPTNVVQETPVDAFIAAADDARHLGGDGKYIRWFTLYNVPARKIQNHYDAFAFHTNSVSREVFLQRIVKPGEAGIVAVTPTLLRVDIRDFTWSKTTWEKLSDFDPYFQAKASSKTKRRTVNYQGRLWARNDSDTDWVDPKTVSEYIETDITSPFLAQTPEGQAAIEYLVQYTGSRMPVVRLDWFIAQTGIERDNQIGYYDFLGLGTDEKDFTDLVGVDLDKIEKAKKTVAALLWKSGVVKNNRRIVDYNGFWATEDFINSKDKRNISQFELGDTDPPKGDASERYAPLANGLFATWLQNAKGKRQNFVPPDTIATDGHTISQDRLIYAGERCFACHVEGLRPVKDYARRIYRDSLELKSVDYDKFVQLRNLYLSDIESKLDQDRTAYARALLEVNGLTPEKNAANYESVFDGYEEDEIDLNKYAIELGTTPEQFTIALRNWEVTHGPLPTALTGLVRKVPITRDFAEQFYQQAQVILLSSKR